MLMASLLIASLLASKETAIGVLVGMADGYVEGMADGYVEGIWLGIDDGLMETSPLLPLPIFLEDLVEDFLDVFPPLPPFPFPSLLEVTLSILLFLPLPPLPLPAKFLLPLPLYENSRVVGWRRTV